MIVVIMVTLWSLIATTKEPMPLSTSRSSTCGRETLKQAPGTCFGPSPNPFVRFGDPAGGSEFALEKLQSYVSVSVSLSLWDL